MHTIHARGLRVALHLFVLLLTMRAFAQGNPNTGFPGGNAGSVPVHFGVVNTSNGNLLLTIPLASIPQRHGSPTTVSLVYNSSFWGTSIYSSGNSQGGGSYAMFPSNPSAPGALYQGLSVVTDPGDTGTMTFSTTVNLCAQPYYYNVTFSNFTWIDSYGGSVPFGNGFSNECITGAGEPSMATTYPSTSRHFNGPRYSLIVTTDGVGNPAKMQVWDQGGNLVSNGTRVDTNGNTNNQDTDQLGRTVTSYPYYPNYSSCTNVQWASQGGDCTYEILSSNGLVSYTITYTVSPICTNFDSIPSGILNQYCGNIVLPTRVKRPDGTSYVFTWDTGSDPGHYGTLTDIQLPQGGHLHYTYTLSSLPEIPIAIQSVSDEDGTTSFSYALGTPAPAGLTGTLPGAYYQTTITYPPRYDVLSGATVSDMDIHTYGYVIGGQLASILAPGIGGCGGVFGIGTGCRPQLLVQTQTPVETKLYNWNLPASNGCGWDYECIDDTAVHTITSSLTGVTNFQSVPGTNLLALLQEDVGQSDARTTVTTYVNDTNNLGIPYNSTYHIFDLPVSRAVYSGSATSGTPDAYTQYVYDEYSASYCKNGVPALKTISGASGHDDSFGASYIARGNVTTIKRLVGGSTYATSHNCYDTLGNVTQTVDPNGNPTTFDYTDSWYDTNYRVSNTYSAPTTITNALGQVTKRKYWSNSSLLAQNQDPNDLAASRTGTLYSYDFMGRTTKVTNPDGGWTATSYQDGPSPQVSKQTCCISASSLTLSQLTLLDGLGRPTQTQLLSDPQGTIYQDTTYDARGRVFSTSTPYYSFADPTYGLTKYAYDYLGRKEQETAPDGSVRFWWYQGLNYTFRDETQNKWIYTFDPYNRMVGVWEYGLDGASPTSTSYSYNDRNDLTNVSQVGNGTSDAPRNRSFTYDALSHLITSTNPETGTVCYGTWTGGTCAGGYDPDGNLLHKTDARGVVTNYSYDALNRLISKGYSNDASATPIACYQYDSVTNGIGRLASHWTLSTAGTCTPSLPGTGYLTLNSITGYDAMGRPTSEQQCTPSNCSATQYSLNYTHDTAGNLLTYTNGLGITPGAPANPLTFTNTYDAADRLQATQSNWNDALHPSSLLNVQSFLPHGAWGSATYGNGAVGISRTYDNRLRITGETDTGQAVKPATAGSATVTITGAEQSK